MVLRKGRDEIQKLLFFHLFEVCAKHPYSGAAGTGVLRPLVSCGHSQILEVTLFCIYDLLTLSSRRKEAEDVSGREQDKNKYTFDVEIWPPYLCNL